MLEKNITGSCNQQKPFELPGFKAERGLSYHGSDFNNNCSLELSKQDLLRIAHAMDDTDTLQIAVPDLIDVESFMNDIKEVTRSK